MSGPTTLLGCAVIMRVHKLTQLDSRLPSGLLDAAADGLSQDRPTWLARDPSGRLCILLTNGEPVAA